MTRKVIWSLLLGAACTPTVASTLGALPLADGTSAETSHRLGVANGHTVGLAALGFSAGPSSQPSDEYRDCTTIEDARPTGPLVITQDCTTTDDTGTSTSKAKTTVDAAVATFAGTLDTPVAWPDGAGDGDYTSEGTNAQGDWQLFEARASIEALGDTMSVDSTILLVSRYRDGAQDSELAGTFNGTFVRLSDDARHLRVSGTGTYGASDIGRADYVTTDLIFDPDTCGHEPVSGTTVVTTPEGDITYSYDGATDCGDDDDGDGTHGDRLVPWTGPAGSGEGDFGICSQGVTPVTWASALAGLIVVGLRRRRIAEGSSAPIPH